VTPEIAARLAALDIQAMAEAKEYFMLTRELCVAMVHRTAEGYSAGSAGMMTGNGLSYLVWREGRALLAGKGAVAEADQDQIDTIRKFSEDIKAAFGELQSDSR
jgi:hypothetical protein